MATNRPRSAATAPRLAPALARCVAALPLAAAWILLLASGAGAQDGALLYPERYYPGTADSASATTVTLAPGQAWTGLDIPMDPAGGAIRGTIVSLGGLGQQPEPLDGVLVEALSRGRRVLTRTGVGGVFRMTGVPAGQALVRYSTDDPRTRENRFQAVFHPGVPEVENAEPVAVVEGLEVDLGEVSLRPGAVLGGFVRAGSGGDPLPGIPVRVFAVTKSATSPAWERSPAASFPGDGGVWTQFTRADGRFFQGGLPAGAYTILADARGTEHIAEYLGGARAPEGAQVLSVRAGDARTDLELTPDRGGAIRGEVREEGTSEPLPGLTVRAIEGVSGESYEGLTGEFGAYRIAGLPAGHYLVHVPALRIYYPDVYNPEEARPIVVTEPNEVSAVDLEGVPGGACRLSPASRGAISGGIRADMEGVVRAIVRVWSETDTLEVPIEVAGSYTVSCLEEESYRVAFLVDGPLRAQYHPKTNRLSEATPVAVSPPDTIFAVDFRPDAAVRLEGRIFDRVSGSGLEGVVIRATEIASGAIAEARAGANGAYVVDRLGRLDDADIRTGLPAGTWRVAAETTLVEDPILTPVLQPQIVARLQDAGRVEVRWELPAIGFWDYEVLREDAQAPARIASGEMYAGAGGPLRVLDEPAAGIGPVRYRLLAWLSGSPGSDRFEAITEWIDPDAGAGGARSLWRLRADPSPWSGRGSVRLRLLRGGAPAPAGEAPACRVRILSAAGREVVSWRTPAGAVDLLWDGRDARGRPVASGAYLARWETPRRAPAGGPRSLSCPILLIR